MTLFRFNKVGLTAFINRGHLNLNMCLTLLWPLYKNPRYIYYISEVPQSVLFLFHLLSVKLVCALKYRALEGIALFVKWKLYSALRL